MGWGLPGILRYLPHPTLVVKPEIDRTLESLPPEARICDVGAGGRRLTPRVVTIDSVAVANVDIVGDIHSLPIENESFDCVFCTGTLEHVRDPWRAVSELHRILRPGGILHVDVPFIQGYHPDPTDYWRFTIDGLRLLCGEFEELAAGTYIGPTCGLVWVVREWANSWSSNRIVSNLLLVPIAVMVAPLKYLDYIMIHAHRSHHVASAFYFRGRKPVAKNIS